MSHEHDTRTECAVNDEQPIFSQVFDTSDFQRFGTVTYWAARLQVSEAYLRLHLKETDIEYLRIGDGRWISGQVLLTSWKPTKTSTDPRCSHGGQRKKKPDGTTKQRRGKRLPPG
jgi:hypothetical protein